MATDWKPVPGERGIYIRDYGQEKAYQIQHQYNKKRYFDVLGAVSLDQARVIRATLIANRKSGAGPQTWAEMKDEADEKERARKLEEESKRRELFEAERKKRTNTVCRLWEDIFWPHRLTLSRSKKETGNMAGRWGMWIKPHFGAITLDELSPDDFMSFIEKARDTGKISDSTIFKCIIHLRQMWNYGLEHGYVSRPFPGKAPAREITRGIDNEKKCWLDPSEVRLLVQTAWERRLNSRIDHDVYCFIILGVALGLRAGDICKLTRQAVERHIIDKTKNRRSRFVHFNYAPVRAMLDERLALYPPDSPEDPLFRPQNNKRQLTDKARSEPPSKYFDLIKELGFNEVDRRKNHPLEKIDFHALRHTFATLAAMRGVDHLTLMRLMGHKTPAMTLRYIEIADAHQAKYQEIAMEGIFPKEISGEGKAIEDDHDLV